MNNQPKATNNCVFVLRDKTESETSGLLLPSEGKVKPNKGTIFSIGSLVKDHNIKNGKGKKALFHKGCGFEIEYEGQTYLVLQGEEIIGIVYETSK